MVTYSYELADRVLLQAVAISHYGFIANVIQMAAHNQAGKGYSLRDARGYRPGDVAIGGGPFPPKPIR